MEKTMVRQAVHLQPMEVDGGADIHLQPMEDPTPEQLEGVKGRSLHFMKLNRCHSANTQDRDGIQPFLCISYLKEEKKSHRIRESQLDHLQLKSLLRKKQDMASHYKAGNEVMINKEKRKRRGREEEEKRREEKRREEKRREEKRREEKRREEKRREEKRREEKRREEKRKVVFFSASLACPLPVIPLACSVLQMLGHACLASPASATRRSDETQISLLSPPVTAL
ncbi:AN1-type zinc finger protein 5-like [Grus japonensis]|uniref:AN1-type zinc finger protein 5-like n=1 Tax=Grus japonensis TaxID=30415 RepID=A0ABC9Y183_GRUJA